MKIELLDVNGNHLTDIEADGDSEEQITAAAARFGYEYLDMWDDRSAIVRRPQRRPRRR